MIKPVRFSPKMVDISVDISTSVGRFNADHAERFELPKPGTGTCPICQHHACFGRVKNDPHKWACFSTSHPDGAGRKGAACFTGDILDLHLLTSNRSATPADRMAELDRLGYLTPTPVATPNRRHPRPTITPSLSRG